MASIRITMLVENTARGPGLLAEHGLSYWIECNGRHVLLDSGQSGVLTGNAYTLGIRLDETGALILSHGHYDHTGGVAGVLRVGRSVAVYAHSEVFARKFTRNHEGSVREIGMPPPSEKAIRDARNGFIATDQSTTVFDRLVATGPIPRLTDFEDTGGDFFLDEACTQRDLLVDDQSVFFNTAKGTVVLLGCAHSGVVNTLRFIRQLTGNRPIHTIIGGMHLIDAALHRIERTIEAFRQFGIEQFAPAHCTGMQATVALWNAFPGRCSTCPVGTRFEFD
jgi:7,8-dihydropterin-6-yl-methyl-4-(beta-D-ribofuranosyl)aminobenzene 5'-phosphate synthase